MFRLFVVLLTSLAGIALWTNACRLNFDPDKAGVFLQPFGSSHIIADTANSYLDIDEGSFTKAYCRLPFKTDNHYSYGYSAKKLPFPRELRVVCEGDSIVLEEVGESPEILNNRLNCESVSGFYEDFIENCGDTGVVYGFSLFGTPVVFAEFCYNVTTMTVSFVHYRSGIRSPILEKQVLFNPSTINYTLDAEMKFQDRGLSAEQMIAMSRKYSEKTPGGTFEMGRLISVDENVGKNMKKFVGNIDPLNRIALWSALKNGNWAKYSGILQKKSERTGYDIYAGTSGVVTYHFDECDNNKTVTYEGPYEKTPIPFYIWNYIVRSNSNDAGVVIIAVNSPFAEFGANPGNNPVFCTDICEQFNWMKPLERQRRIPTMGYIFCCHPDDIKGNLDNFPAFARKQTLMN